MKRLVLLFLLFGLGSPANAFLGATEEEKAYCRRIASGERNEWSAKQTYKYCFKNLRDKKKKKIEDEKLKIQKAQKLKKSCEKTVKKYKWEKNLIAESKATKEWNSLSPEQRKIYMEFKYGEIGFERYYYEKYGGTLLRWNKYYGKYVRDGCKELSIDGYKIKLYK